MAFLNGLLLGFTALGSIPIIIHLLNKRRFRVVIWAAMEFLLRALKKNQRRIQLRDIILMMIRCLAVVMLALALARPTLHAEGFGFLGGRAGVAAVILIDNSMSMNYFNGRETRFDVARKLAKDVVGQFEKGTWISVITFADDPVLPLGDPSQNLDFVKQEIDKLKQSDGTTNLEAALIKAKEVFDAKREFQAARKELYLITDFQSCSWRDATSKFAETWKSLDELSDLYLINAGEGGRENLAVREVRTLDELITCDTPVLMTAEIKNYGDSEAVAVPVDLIIRDKPVARQTVDIPAGETVLVNFDHKFDRGGDQQAVTVKLEDSRLAADNSRHMVIDVLSDIKVLVVDGKPGDDELQTEGFYLFRALNLTDPESETKAGASNAEIVPAYRVGDRNLSNYQVVVLSNVPDLANPVIYERFVRNGGGLIVFLGDQVKTDQYNRKMLEGNVKLLPAMIGKTIGDDEKRESHVGVSAANLSHPVVKFFDTPECKPLIAELKFFKRYEMTPAEGEDISVTARFQDDKPLIAERKIGAGYVWMVASPASTKWTNFPTQYAFPIIVNRAVQYMALGVQPPKNVAVGTRLSGIVPPEDQAVPLTLREPPPRGGQRQIEAFQTPDRRVMFEVLSTPFAGFYYLKQERSNGKEFLFSANPQCAKESDLAAVGAEYVRESVPNLDFLYLGRTDDLGARLKSKRQGTEIWWIPMFMACLLLAAESYLALRWAPKV